MIRRFISTVALVACAAGYVWAAANAEFVLTNGQRRSGTLVYGRGSNNIVDSRFHLNVNGSDESFGINDVAAIEFASGAPITPAEVQNLPTDTTGLIVMRDGSTQRGHLQNIVEGDQVQWVNESGQRHNIPVSQVNRVYLNGQAARSAMNLKAGMAAVGTAGQTTLEPGAIRVEANQAWTETGIVVRTGDLVSFRGTGQIAIGNGQNASVDGNDQVRPAGLPVNGMPEGGLIAKVGNSAPFPIGANTQPIRMPADGRLMLGVNDTNPGDNSGFFSVVVTKTGRRQ